ncbi:Ribonuclease VapC9 [Geodia barretti]|uniref:Ribonuclease VapC9 n=1 Tax=Geodia barretti TaxID=519541 RepID=A0AA35X8X9_GEOBA|nr:Ribonuclease VapC9 [Geodia barretti]
MRLLESGESLHAPHLLDLEIAQVLRRYMLTGELTPRRGKQALTDLADFPIIRYPHALFLSRIWALRHNVTTCDAAYLALAESLPAPNLLNVIVGVSPPAENGADTVHRMFCGRSFPNEQALLGGHHLDLDVWIHPEAVPQGFGDGDLTTFGDSHVYSDSVCCLNVRTPLTFRPENGINNSVSPAKCRRSIRSRPGFSRAASAIFGHPLKHDETRRVLGEAA